MKHRKRIKRWFPNVSFMDITVNIPVMVMLGLLFITGQSIVFGVEGGELQTIPIPKVPIAGWLLVYLALEQLLPPVIKRRINLREFLANKIKSLVLRFKGTDDISARIKSLGGKW